jgi:hypothetical protein
MTRPILATTIAFTIATWVGPSFTFIERSVVASAQGRQTPARQASGAVPRTADGHPDSSGLWQGGGPIGDIAQGLPKGETIPLAFQAP